MFDTGSVSGGSFASPPGSVSEVDYTGSIGLASTLHAGCSMARGDVLNDVVCTPVYDSGHVTSPGAIGCEGSSLLDMSFNSPLCSGMRRSPSAVFARAQRHMHRPPLTPEEAGDIAQYTQGCIGSESQAWSKLKHQPAYSIGASTREAEHKRMFGTSHGVGPCDHAGDVSKLLPRSPAATFGTTKRTLVVAADETPGISYLPPSTLRSNRVALFGSSDRVDVSSTRAYAAPGPGAYSVEDAVEKTRLQRAPVVSFARSQRSDIVKPLSRDGGSTGPGPTSYRPQSLGVLASFKRSSAVGFPSAKRF